MRKLKQLAVVTLAVGSLSAFGAGVSFADTTGQSAPQGAQSQQDQSAPQEQPASQGQQAPQQMQGQETPQQAPQQAPQGTQVAPQVAPQVSPNITLPQTLPLGAAPQAAPQTAPQEQNNLFRPYQECSPQTVLQANIPIALLGDSKTQGDTCTQVNNAFNE